MEKKVHPGSWTRQNIATMKAQLKRLGFALDWTRELATCEPDYYGHEQAIFLDFFESGLVYRKESAVNWDPVDMTVLANEQVIDGRGWRSGALVERRKLSQWFLKITAVRRRSAERRPRARALARQGQADAGELDRQVRGPAVPLRAVATAATSRSSPPGPTRSSDRASSRSRRTIRSRRRWRQGNPEVAGVHRALQAGRHHRGRAGDAGEAGLRYRAACRTHPFDLGWELPVYIANFVLMDYGTGAVFGVPAHDQRDFEFATKYELPIRRVVSEGDKTAPEFHDAEAYSGPGTLVNSHFLDGMDIADAKRAVITPRRGRRLGQGHDRVAPARLGRQPPALLGHADPDHPLRELRRRRRAARSAAGRCCPRTLAFDIPGNPLDRHPTWKHVDCPKCMHRRGAKPTRSTPSSIRPGISSASPASPTTSRSTRQVAEQWLPVGQYIGGVEHAILHLLYARFFTRALDAYRQARRRRAVRRPVHPGDGDARDLQSASEGTLALARGDPTKDGADVVQIAIRRCGRRSAASRRCPSRRRTPSIPSRSSTNMAPMRCAGSCSPTAPPERDLEWSENGIEGAALRPAAVAPVRRARRCRRARTRISTQAASHDRGRCRAISRR